MQRKRMQLLNWPLKMVQFIFVTHFFSFKNCFCIFESGIDPLTRYIFFKLLDHRLQGFHIFKDHGAMSLYSLFFSNETQSENSDTRKKFSP